MCYIPSELDCFLYSYLAAYIPSVCTAIVVKTGHHWLQLQRNVLKTKQVYSAQRNVLKTKQVYSA